MSKQTKNNQIQFQFKNIEILDLNLIFPGSLINQLETFHFKIQLHHRINEINKLLFVDTTVDIFHNDETTKLGAIKVTCVFHIKNILDFKPTEEKQFDLPEDFLLKINSITLSTVRGVMYSELKGTFLHNAILPLLNPSKFERIPESM